MILLNPRPSIYKKKEQQTWQKMIDLRTSSNMVYFDPVSRLILTTSRSSQEISVFDEHGQLLKSISARNITTNNRNPCGMCVNHLTGELLLCLDNIVVCLT